MARRLLTALLLAGASLLALPAAAIAAPASAPAPSVLEPVGPGASVLGVDDFVFAGMTVDYELGRDGDGRSTLRTTEHLVAVFPEFDQNRGIRRAIPAIYQGHPTHVEVVSVTDETGAPRSYEAAVDGEFLTLTIAVPEGRYVHGEQHYVIEYTQRDVTHYFADTDDDEFYWDVNGTGWAQPFGRVAATVTLEDDLVGAVRETACYFGPEGSQATCDASRDGAVVTAEATDLGPHENLSVVVAFEPGTFAAAPFDPLAHARTFVPLPALIGIALGVVNIVFGVVVGLTRRNARGRGTVIAQYEPPADVSVFLAADILARPSKAMAATIVDLAVRRKLRIVERDGSWGRNDFGLQRIDASGAGLLPDEQRIMDAVFFGRVARAYTVMQAFGFGGGTPLVHADGDEPVRWLTKRDTVLGQHVVAQRKATRADAVRRGLRRKPAGWPVLVAVLLTVASFGLTMVTGVTSSSDSAITVGVLGSIASMWVGIIVVAGLSSQRPLTRAGAELREHLEGLKEFIRWAEEDRLRMLQSVTGAEREPLDPVPGARPGTDPRVVRVYERLLPYAVLFGLEREWARELGRYYDESSYSGSASSSSSGGSGGGGSSGGGGGGGGGGGV